MNSGEQTCKVDRQTVYTREVLALENITQILTKTVDELVTRLSIYNAEDSAKDKEVAGSAPTEWIPPGLAGIRQSREVVEATVGVLKRLLDTLEI